MVCLYGSRSTERIQRWEKVRTASELCNKAPIHVNRFDSYPLTLGFQVKINKLISDYRAVYLETAFASNFCDMPVISLTEDGKFRWPLSKDFLLSGFIGVGNGSQFALGVSRKNGNFIAQGINVKDDDLVSHLRDALKDYPGIKEVVFSAHDIGGVCYLVTIHWDTILANRIRNVLGAIYQTKGFNYFLEARTPENFYGNGLSKRALARYLELKRDINPGAIELRFDVSALPDLLGLRAERAVASAAEAAFGRNGGVDCAIYVQAGFGTHLSRAAIGVVTNGDDRDRLKSIKNLSPAQSMKPNTEQPARTWHEASNTVAQYGYSLGSDIFEIVDSVAGAICQSDELFRHDHVAPPGFDASRFTSVMRELVVNSFCHGHWEVTEVGRDDDDHNEATRLAIVHASNRLEVINRLRPAGYLQGQTGFETATRRSPLHDAFRDIDFAKGRSLGLKLIRKRLSNLNFSAPIFIKKRNVFRAIIPLLKQFEEWGYPTSESHVSKEEIGQLYALRLSLLLREVDQDVIASALYIQSSEAVKILEGLSEKGALSKIIPSNDANWSGYSEYLMPSYEISSDEKAHQVIDYIVGGMNIMPSQTSLSIGALYQLSIRSISHLTNADLEQWIFKVFAGEMVDEVYAQQLASEHMAVLRSNHILRYPNS